MIILWGMIFYGPALAILFAIALILPRMLVGWYAFYAIAAIVIFVKIIDAHDDGALAGLGTFAFEVLAIGTVIVGLLVRCVVGEMRRPE